MSLTISELEEQRAKILEEIESKAGKISSSNTSNEGTPSLNDWLNAAEKVMPENPKNTVQQSTQKSSYSNKLLSNSKSNNKTSFFGVVIMLSLFLTILGVLYIAYSSIHKELQNVLVIKDENIEQMKLLQADMKSLQQAVTTGGKTELFNELELKVIALQAEVNELKSIIASKPLSDLNQSLNSSSEESTVSEEMSQTSLIKNVSNKVVTEAVLDQKLKSYTEQLENKIDRKLEKILQHLTNKAGVETLPGLEDSNDKQDTKEIDTPVVETVNTPEVKEPLVKLVDEVVKPKAPAAPDAPIVNISSDVRWLMAQPKAHYILQLASMPTESAVKKIIESNQLKETKILPQTRNKLTNYILVTGSFAARSDADARAKEIKSQYGISVWIRKVKDLTGRIQ
ncbi:SPOR domain-containing protein [Thiomicrorhabdus sp. Kp2]|uniref:SPOR domain-containing protein n=1 Tax=Thiomicrorhabdus sp. Kp2 TaxID=1123518 RepID=UPI00040D0929|nr:SPOR domain-containing protein [Thiomicrorhabdus sp. Kp2]